MMKKVVVAVLIVVLLGIGYYLLFVKKNPTEQADLSGQIELPTEQGVFGAVFTEEQLNSVMKKNLDEKNDEAKPVNIVLDLHDGYADLKADWQDGQSNQAKLVADETSKNLLVTEADAHQDMFSGMITQILEQFFADNISIEKLEIKDQRLIAYFRSSQ